MDTAMELSKWIHLWIYPTYIQNTDSIKTIYFTEIPSA